MGILRSLFGPSREEIWRQLCNEIDADYVAGGFWKGDKVEGRHKDWTITLDTYTVSSGKHSTTYTRLRAPFVNADGFYFEIYRKSLFSGLGKALGMQDIEVGEAYFDEEFVIKGNDEAKVRRLFANALICDLIQRQPKVHFTVKDDEGWFGAAFPKGTDELYFRVAGVITDVHLLKELYLLFAETLDELCRIGSAYEDEPGVRF